jgi:hypothetical protein
MNGLVNYLAFDGFVAKSDMRFEMVGASEDLTHVAFRRTD